MANQAGMPLGSGRAGRPQEPLQQPLRSLRFQDEDDVQEDRSPGRNKRLSTARDSEGEILIPKIEHADDNDGDSSDEGAHRLEHVQLLGSEKVIIDDRAASYVLVFPRQKQRYKGKVDPTATNKNPREAWERIFGKQLEARKTDRVPPELKKGPVQEGLYQALVRQKVLQILQESGLRAESIESIDRDEVFLKIAFDIDGRMIHKLAETFQYKVPFKAECYQNEPKFGSYPGGRPMRNNHGVPVPLYAECSEDLQDKLEGFRHVDEVRLIIKHLASCMDIVEMEKQKVITRHFAGANFMSVQRLNGEWSLFHNLFKVPTDEFDKEIRDYFGEEVAFFFKWFALYLRYLAMLGALGMLAAMGTFEQFGLDLSQRDHVLEWFGLALVVWETVFQKVSKENITRAAQVWGMADYDSTEDSLFSYDSALEGTSVVSLRRSALTVVMLLYVFLFSVIIFVLNVHFNHLKMDGKTQVAALQPIVQTVIIKFLSFTWRKIAYRLVLWQNHRTRTRFNNTLVRSLIIVKLFVALYPFFFTAFLRRYWTSTCGMSLSEAAHKVYRIQDWPKGVQISYTAVGNASIPEADLHFLDGFSYMKGNQTCISGCYPVSCESDSAVQECTSSCMYSMQESLKTLYVTHFGLTAINILVPIFWTRHVIFKELQKVQKRNGDREVPYSFLQIQAKCPEYIFASWGGSFVEDFLELIVSYALLACFGVCYPLMATIGFVCLLVEYRLLAYRMTNVTCRPEPRGTRGLGQFHDILEAVSILAVSFNAGIVVTLMMPYRKMPLGRQLGTFVLVEKGLLVLRAMISFVIPGDPADVMLIEDFNAGIKKKLLQSDVSAIDESADWSQVKVGLAHDPGDRLLGENSGEEGEETEEWEDGKSSGSDKDAFC